MSINIYNPSIPQPDDELSDSQGDILNNFSALDNIFGKDHVKYSNRSTDQGKHDRVTTVAAGSHESTNADEPRFYAFEDNSNIGVIQYSRKGSDAVPSPVTYLQSSSSTFSISAGSTQTILDLTGLSTFIIHLYASGTRSGSTGPLQVSKTIVKNGAGTTGFGTTGPFRAATTSAGLIQLSAGSGAAVTNIRWTIQFLRLQ